MTKKLQKFEYASKAQFQSDLNLIYSNCRTYNTDPVTSQFFVVIVGKASKIYLLHADAMEKKSKELMKNMKNIDISEKLKGFKIEQTAQTRQAVVEVVSYCINHQKRK